MNANALTLIAGPMYAGKSTELRRRIARLRLGQQPVVVIKHAADVARCGSGIVTHDGLVDKTDVHAVVKLEDARKCVTDGKVHVFVDEVQFFNDLKEMCCEWIAQGNSVTVAALNAKADGTMWPPIAGLLPYCTAYVHLNAVCRCGADAPLTRARTGVQIPTSGVHIGAQESYEARCVKCMYVQ